MLANRDQGMNNYVMQNIRYKKQHEARTAEVT